MTATKNGGEIMPCICDWLYPKMSLRSPAHSATTYWTPDSICSSVHAANATCKAFGTQSAGALVVIETASNQVIHHHWISSRHFVV